MSKNQVFVKVPATTANLGAGFDCIGAAISLYNQFQFRLAEEKLKITVTGAEANKVIKDSSNLLYQCFVKFYEHIGQPTPAVEIEIELGVPLARGLGSSATAIVGGLMAANVLADNPLPLKELTDLAIAIEGHPDNVVPALLGGCQLSVKGEQGWEICPIAWSEKIIPIIAIPEFELSTEQARAVLPTQISRKDAIFNISHFGLLLKALESNRGDWLSIALEDKIHQPYRQSLIKGYEEVKKAAKEAGAYGMVISGAGPTLLALCEEINQNAVTQAMANTWLNLGVKAEVKAFSLAKNGCTCGINY